MRAAPCFGKCLATEVAASPGKKRRGTLQQPSTRAMLNWTPNKTASLRVGVTSQGVEPRQKPRHHDRHD